MAPAPAVRHCLPDPFPSPFRSQLPSSDPSAQTPNLPSSPVPKDLVCLCDPRLRPPLDHLSQVGKEEDQAVHPHVYGRGCRMESKQVTTQSQPSERPFLGTAPSTHTKNLSIALSSMSSYLALAELRSKIWARPAHVAPTGNSQQVLPSPGGARGSDVGSESSAGPGPHRLGGPGSGFSPLQSEEKQRPEAGRGWYLCASVLWQPSPCPPHLVHHSRASISCNKMSPRTETCPAHL